MKVKDYEVKVGKATERILEHIGADTLKWLLWMYRFIKDYEKPNEDTKKAVLTLQAVLDNTLENLTRLQGHDLLSEEGKHENMKKLLLSIHFSRPLFGRIMLNLAHNYGELKEPTNQSDKALNFVMIGLYAYLPKGSAGNKSEHDSKYALMADFLREQNIGNGITADAIKKRLKRSKPDEFSKTVDKFSLIYELYVLNLPFSKLAFADLLRENNYKII